MTQLPTTTTTHARQLQEEYPWVWLYEVEVPPLVEDDPPSRVRVTNHTSAITRGAASDGTPIVFSPYPVTHSEITQNAKGDVPRFSVQFGQGGLEIVSILDAWDGLVGQPAVVRIVNVDELSNPSAEVRFDAIVVACEFDWERVQLTLGDYNLTELRVPGQRFTKYHCRHVYKSPACGYSGGLATCARTIDDCRAHSNSKRIGLFPAIGRQGRR